MAKSCPVLTFTVNRIPRGVVIEAYAGGGLVPVGFATANVKKKDGQKVFVVGNITVEKQVRHCGVGTAIYKKMAVAAQERQAILASDTNRSWYSDKFWQKQVKRGTAKCVKPTKEEITSMRTDYSIGRSGCAYYILKGGKVA